MVKRSWRLYALLLALSGCGGDEDGGNQAPPPPPLSDSRKVDLALAAHAPLPVFPLTPPTVENPLLNENGVILDERNNSFNPSIISRFALERYSRWRTNQPSTGEDWIKTALRQTDWLAANLDCQSGVGVWRFSFSASYDAEPGWTSGFANAHGIAALLIMSRFIPDPERYIRPALCALGPFEADVEEGGFVTMDSAGPWYEEYATKARSGVLNGHVFALAGLWYACTYGEVTRACTLFDKGAVTLRARLPRYDAGFTSRYSTLTQNYASPGYNQLQSQVLAWLYGVTNEPVFKSYADLFADYEADQYELVASYTADPVSHGTDNLNDGYWWYGYWSSYGPPPTIDIDMATVESVRAVAIAFAGDELLPFEYAIVGPDGAAGPYLPSPEPTSPTHYVLNEFRTSVGVYPLGISARRIRLRFTVPIPGTDVTALREINVLH